MEGLQQIEQHHLYDWLYGCGEFGIGEETLLNMLDENFNWAYTWKYSDGNNCKKLVLDPTHGLYLVAAVEDASSFFDKMIIYEADSGHILNSKSFESEIGDVEIDLNGYILWFGSYEMGFNY